MPDSVKTYVRSLPQLALPETHNGIATLARLSPHTSITGAVSSKLGRPIRNVCFRSVATPWTAMPKAPMYKDRNSSFREKEVRGTNFFQAVELPSPDSVPYEQR